jgi:hypothetical protein
MSKFCVINYTALYNSRRHQHRLSPLWSRVRQYKYVLLKNKQDLEQDSTQR